VNAWGLRGALYSAIDQYWGNYYASIPSFAGQDLDKSKAYFDKAIGASPNNLEIRVGLASSWAVKAHNRSVFDESTKYVLSANASAEPEMEPENRVAQAKAQELKDKASSLFP
jgi:hypothetical protein